MRQVCFTAYTWDEASNELKEKILMNHRDINVDYMWWEQCYEDFQENLLMGFNNPTIYFSGFWSQGDGACFMCNNIDVMEIDKTHPNLFPKPLKKFLPEYQTYAPYIKKTNHHYEHAHTCEIAYEAWSPTSNRKIKQAAFDKIENKLEELRLHICYEIYKTLEKTYNYLTSDESIIETIKANEYDFFETGEIAG